MSLLTYYLEYGRHVARLRRRRTYPRAIPLAMKTTRKSIHVFPFFLLYIIIIIIINIYNNNNNNSKYIEI